MDHTYMYTSSDPLGLYTKYFYSSIFMCELIYCRTFKTIQKPVYNIYQIGCAFKTQNSDYTYKVHCWKKSKAKGILPIVNKQAGTK